MEQEFGRVEAVNPDHLLQPEEQSQSAEEEGEEHTSLLTVDTTTTAEHDLAPLSLEIDPALHVTAEEEDMSSQLNPDALEFVPLSPHSSAPVSPSLKMDLDMDEQFKSMQPPPLIAAIMDNDRILAQSPRKNNTAQLDNVPMPDENEFDIEISNRPHELSVDFIQSNGKQIDLNGSAVSNGESEASLQVDVDDEEAGALNSKEERDLDEEKEELRDEVIKEIIDNIPEELNGHSADEIIAAVPGEQDPMNMSFHQDVQMAQSANPFDLNAVQLLPNDDIEEEDERSAKGDFNERPEVEQRMEQLSLEEQAAAPVVAENPLPEADFGQAPAPEADKPMELTESESNFYMQQPEEEPERKEFDEKEEEALQPAVELKVETPPPTPAAVNDVLVQDLMQAASPEPQKLVEAVEKLAEVETVVPVAEQKPEKSLETEVAIVATLGVVAGAAVAMTAAKAGAKKPAAGAAKSKTPNTLGVKTSATTTRATPTKMASPSVASRLTPTAASRTAASKASPATIRSPLAEKKTLPATTPTSAAKRTTPSRPLTAASLSGASPKPSTTTRLSTSARTPTSLASPKPPTTSRLSATKTTTSATTTAAAAKKPTTGTSAGLASRWVLLG